MEPESELNRHCELPRAYKLLEGDDAVEKS